MSIYQKKTQTPVSRRTFIKGVSATTALLPFVPVMNASAQVTGPKRLILVFTPHGTVFENWKPKGTEADWQLSPILMPLERHKKKLTVLSGVEILAPGVGAPHTKGPPLLWTASKLLEDQTFSRSDGSGGRFFGWNSGPSVDQVIANVTGTKTLYRSLEFGVRAGGSHPGSRMIYAGPRQPLPPESNPYAAFDRLFNASGKSFDQLRAERRSSLDVVKAELDALRPKAAGEDKRKLDQHLESVRGMELRLSLAAVACPGPASTAPGMTRLDPAMVMNGPTIWERQIDVLTAALSCDLTRVASLQFRVGENDNDRYTWLNVTHEGHHLITHGGDMDALTKTSLTTIYTSYAEKFAYLLDRLDAVKEDNGSSILDNSLVVWGSELGKGNSHSFKRTPFVVAGGGRNALKPGRFLDFEANGGKGAIHNRLLVSLCHGMGLTDVAKFGNTDTGTGPLTGFLG